jgi:hypothetical protein
LATCVCSNCDVSISRDDGHGFIMKTRSWQSQLSGQALTTPTPHPTPSHPRAERERERERSDGSVMMGMQSLSLVCPQHTGEGTSPPRMVNPAQRAGHPPRECLSEGDAGQRTMDVRERGREREGGRERERERERERASEQASHFHTQEKHLARVDGKPDEHRAGRRKARELLTSAHSQNTLTHVHAFSLSRHPHIE